MNIIKDRKISWIVLSFFLIYALAHNQGKAQIVVPSKTSTSWTKYDIGSSNRLCIFLTDSTSSWLGISGGLAAQGIPFRITDDIDEALKHKVVLIYPGLASHTLNLPTLKKLRKHPSDGGVLIGFNVVAPSMYKVFGLKRATYSTQRDTILISQYDLPETRFIEDINEGRLRIGNLNVTSENTITTGYLDTSFAPLAVFEDGSAAIIRNLFNDGAAYAFGLDLGLLALSAHANLDPEIQRSHVNKFEPVLDVFFKMIRTIYIEYADFPITIGTVPGNKMVPILITHNIDQSNSLDTMLLYAKLEASYNVPATYFIQTTDIEKIMAIPLITQDDIPKYFTILNMGMEIGSLVEAYSGNRSFYEDFNNRFSETLLDELRTSHHISNQLFGVNATSFRSGYLGYPEKLHICMKEVGFKYGSSITANELLTHMPVNTMYNYMLDDELDIYELPITIEDQELPKMDQRINEAIVLTEKIAHYGGLVNILIHPDIMGHKYRFLEIYLRFFKDKAWFGTVSQYGDWWKARTSLQVDAETLNQFLMINIEGPHSIKNLPLDIPKHYKYISAISDVGSVTKTKSGYLIERIDGKTKLFFQNQKASSNK